MANPLHSEAADSQMNLDLVLTPHAVRRNFSEDGSLDLSTVALAKVEVVTAKCEPSVAEAMAGRPGLKDAKTDVSAEALAKAELRYQFDLSAVVPNAFGTKEERLGYVALDVDSKPGKLVFNRTITLKDSWAKIDKH